MQTEESFLSTFSSQVGLYKGNAGEQNAKVFLNTAHQLLRSDMLKALGPNFGSDSEANTTAWFNNLKADAIAKVYRELSTVDQPRLLERQPVFSSESSIVGNMLSKSGRFLGTRFTATQNDVLLNVVRIGPQLSSGVTDFPLYVFNSLSVEPVRVINLTGNTINRTIWTDNNIAPVQIDANGYYIIGYFEKDLPANVQVVGGQRSFDTACGTCGGQDGVIAKKRAQYVKMEAISVTGQQDNEGQMTWSMDAEAVSTRQTWGLNYIITAECNRNAILLNAVLFQVANDVLEYFLSSDRVNAIAAQMMDKDLAYTTLYGDRNTSDIGVAGKLAAALKTAKGALSSANCCKVAAPVESIQMYND